MVPAQQRFHAGDAAVGDPLPGRRCRELVKQAGGAVRVLQHARDVREEHGSLAEGAGYRPGGLVCIHVEADARRARCRLDGHAGDDRYQAAVTQDREHGRVHPGDAAHSPQLLAHPLGQQQAGVTAGERDGAPDLTRQLLAEHREHNFHDSHRGVVRHPQSAHEAVLDAPGVERRRDVRAAAVDEDRGNPFGGQSPHPG